MLDPQTLSTLALALAALAVAGCGVCFALVRRARTEARDMVAVALTLEGDLAATSRDLDAATERASAQARRIAWLEARVRHGSPVAAAEMRNVAPVPDKMNITERRHRVIALAQRGLDTAAIAATLGLPHGEIELIVGLSRAA